jgi:hypothetical protein
MSQMTPETEAAREHVATALDLIDGEAWRGTGADEMERAPDLCATLCDIERLQGQFPAPFFDGMHALITKVRAELIAARSALERLA